MANVILSVIGWGLFYWVVSLYIFWVVVERTFFAGQDPERWDPNAHIDKADSAGHEPQPTLQPPYITALGRPA